MFRPYLVRRAYWYASRAVLCLRVRHCLSIYLYVRVYLCLLYAGLTYLWLYACSMRITLHLGRPHANLQQTLCQPWADLMPTSGRPHANLVQTSYQPWADLMVTLCRPHTNLGQTSCQPQANLMPTSYRPHDNLMQT